MTLVAGPSQRNPTVLYESDDFTFPDTNPPPPQNIILHHALSELSDIGVIHFYLKQSSDDGGRSTEKETDIMALKDLPIITNSDFTARNTRKTHVIEIPRLQGLNNTRQFGDALLFIGKISDSELRISCSHPVINGGTLRIKAIEYE